jgi:hypothetical protein
VTAFLISGAVVVGVPVGIGLHGHFKRSAERRVADLLRAYCQAQYAYHAKDRDGDEKLEYCRKLPDLAGLRPETKSDAEPAEPWVGEDFAAAHGAGGRPLHGYLFAEMKTIWEIPINWDGDFALCAVPADYGRTGRLTFIIKTDGDVWVKDLGSAELLDDYPSMADTKGWRKAEGTPAKAP